MQLTAFATASFLACTRRGSDDFLQMCWGMLWDDVWQLPDYDAAWKRSEVLSTARSLVERWRQQQANE